MADLVGRVEVEAPPVPDPSLGRLTAAERALIGEGEERELAQDR